MEKQKPLVIKLGTFGGAKVAAFGIGVGYKEEPKPFINFSLDYGNGPTTVKWEGSMQDAEWAQRAIESVVTAGFNGDSWEDFRSGDMKFFEPRDFNLSLEKVSGEGEKGAYEFVRAKFINKPVKEFKGEIQKMAGSFSKAKAAAGVKSKATETESWD